jgi:hypothetical protein
VRTNPKGPLNHFERDDVTMSTRSTRPMMPPPRLRCGAISSRRAFGSSGGLSCSFSDAWIRSGPRYLVVHVLFSMFLCPATINHA